MMHPLDPLAVPLQGRTLIEASAGTGKTYTIVLLYLRILLEQAVPVEQILVLTFTRAATEELRTRIRARIREALDLLEKRGTRGAADPFLFQVIQRAGSEETSRRRLFTALVCLDEAAIHTIHGFCQRMLQDHAFESSLAYDLEFLQMEEDIRMRIMEDFWRQQFYCADPVEARWASDTWGDPGKLYQEVNELARWLEARFEPRIEEAAVQELENHQKSLYDRLCHLWAEERNRVAEILAKDRCLRRSAKSYRQDRIPLLLAAMDRLVTSPESLWSMEKECWMLAATQINGLLKKNCQAPVHPVFSLMDELVATNTAWLKSKRIGLLLAGRDFLLQELARWKAEEGKLAFDDLLVMLDRALAGPRGRELRLSIGRRFPYALIDEFQDTDPLQYRIIRSIYGDQQQAGLFLIGDPKQAIYSFRGADIFTYLRARADTSPEKRFTMITNYRASGSMVGAVNRLFDFPGSFVLKDGIGYQPVRASDMHNGHQLMIRDQPHPPLTALLFGLESDSGGIRPLAKEKARTLAVTCCCKQIAHLLHGAARDEVRLGERRLEAGDIAVLVRTNREAAQVRQTLAGLGLGAVYYSQESVFESSEAGELQLILAALGAPENEKLVRRALVTDLFGLGGNDIERLMEDEQEWEEWRDRLDELNQSWREQGVAAMFQRLLRQQGVVRRLAGSREGERRLTNFLHLVELLQEEEQRQPGMERLAGWLQRQRLSPRGETADQQLRLEHDEELIRIVTLHKAKGLEYPLVFLPFVWDARPCVADGILRYHDRNTLDRCLVVDLGSGDEDALARAEEERLAEDLRLLYVGITRAKSACFFAWGPVGSLEHCGLAHLLRQGSAENVLTGKTKAEFIGVLRRLNDNGTVLSIQEKQPEPPQDILAATPSIATTLTVASFRGQIDRSWQISSYSRMVAREEEAQALPSVPEAAPECEGMDRFHFPRGPVAGTCLHAILEELDFSDPGGEAARQLIRDQLRRAGLAERWLPVVRDWLQDVCTTALLPGFCLADLPASRQVREMGFYFPLSDVDISRLNTVLRRYGFAPLRFKDQHLQGLMTGYIDLVFSWKDRYYVADYKSNYLGASPHCYGSADLARTMVEHRYDLQYLIYTVALHRYLRTRIRNYTCGQYLGGACYLFLRGMQPGQDTGIVFRPVEQELVEALDRCFASPEEIS